MSLFEKGNPLSNEEIFQKICDHIHNRPIEIGDSVRLLIASNDVPRQYEYVWVEVTRKVGENSWVGTLESDPVFSTDYRKGHMIAFIREDVKAVF